MKKGITLIIFLLAISIVGVINASTPIKVETYPNNFVSIEAIDTSKDQISLDHFSGNASADGIFTTSYTKNQNFYLMVIVSKDKKFVVPPTKFGPFVPGTGLAFKMTKDEVKQVVEEKEEQSKCNESWLCTEWSECKDEEQTRECSDANDCGTSANKPATTQSCEESKNPITGLITGIKDATIEINENINWAYVLYAILGIIVIGGVVFFIIKKPLGKRKLLILNPKEENDAPNLDLFNEKELLQAEEKIKQAHEEIEKIRNRKNELSQAEKQYKEAKERLEKLRKGKN